MGRQYTALMPSGLARTVQFDAFELTPADDKPIVLHHVVIGQTTDLGDANEEVLVMEILRGGTAMTSGSGGTGSLAAQTPIARDPVDTASGVTYDTGNETLATFTSGVTVWREPFNIRIGLDRIFIPEERIECSQANGGIVVRISAPADSVTWGGGTLVFEET